MKTPTIKCKCGICGKQFVGHHKLHKYCSDKCRDAQYTAVCMLCGARSTHTSHLRRENNTKLCKRCYDNSIKPINLIRIITSYKRVNQLENQLKLYENMFAAQDDEITEYKSKIRQLKDDIDYLKRQLERQDRELMGTPFNKNQNRYNAKFNVIGVP
jgi:Skp family chaperone for outer membrane proteins